MSPEQMTKRIDNLVRQVADSEKCIATLKERVQGLLISLTNHKDRTEKEFERMISVGDKLANAVDRLTTEMHIFQVNEAKKVGKEEGKAWVFAKTAATMTLCASVGGLIVKFVK
jgi:hypothetical protein